MQVSKQTFNSLAVNFSPLVNISYALSTKSFGKILDDGWKIKKTLSKKISNKVIDDIYNMAKKKGAYGGKLSGAGGGCFLSFVVRKNLKKDFIKALSEKKMQYLPLESDTSGSIIL